MKQVSIFCAIIPHILAIMASLYVSGIYQNVQKRAQPYIPMFLVFLSGLGFSIQTLFVKLLSVNGYKGSFNLVLSRGCCQTFVTSFLVYYDEDRRSGNSPKLFGDTNYVRLMLVLRAITGYFGAAFSFLAVEYLPVGDSSTLVMLSPIFASILSYFILGEPWRIPEFIGSILALIGAVLIAKPTFIFGGLSLDPIGVFYALFSAASAAGAFVCIRILGTSAKMPYANICFVQGISQIVLSIPSSYISGQGISLNVDQYDILLIFLGGFIGAFSQIAMTIGMQREKSASATAMRMSDVAFGYVWQILFTSDKASLISIAGAVLVTSSILFIVFFKQVNQPPKSPVPAPKADNDDIEEIELYGNPMIENSSNAHNSSKNSPVTENHSTKEDPNLLATSMSMLSKWSTNVRSGVRSTFIAPVYKSLPQQEQI